MKDAQAGRLAFCLGPGPGPDPGLEPDPILFIPGVYFIISLSQLRVHHMSIFMTTFFPG